MVENYDVKVQILQELNSRDLAEVLENFVCGTTGLLLELSDRVTVLERKLAEHDHPREARK